MPAKYRLNTFDKNDTYMEIDSVAGGTHSSVQKIYKNGWIEEKREREEKKIIWKAHKEWNADVFHILRD